MSDQKKGDLAPVKGCALPIYTKIRRNLSRRVFGFGKDQGGSMIIFSLTIFIIGLVATGMAIDFMRHEYMRTRLQATLDRAILAAADLDQKEDPKEVVKDYFKKSGLDRYNLNVDVQQGLNYRKVSAVAESEVNSMFLNMVGIDSIDAPANGAAQERKGKVEISLVLDISGSMRDNKKIDNLREAASDFMDLVVTTKNRDLVSVSLIPYTGQTNAGEDLFNYIKVDKKHDYSHCVEFDDDADFTSVPLDFAKKYKQMQHFEYSGAYYETNGEPKIENPWCSDKENETIKLYMNDNPALKNIVKAYEPRTATGIHYAMKWGAALLDPSMRPLVSSLIKKGKIDKKFDGRPANYNASDTLKVVVLMTDGMNVHQYRIRNWAYDSAKEYERWSKYTLWYYVNNFGNSHWSYYRTYKMNSSEADTKLKAICKATNDLGIMVFSIGFELENETAVDVMRSCASSDNQFFKVSGKNLTNAFADIARTINNLRLVK